MCLDAGSTTLPSGGDAKDATPKKQCGNTEEGFNGRQHALECIIYVKKLIIFLFFSFIRSIQ